jgi:hypothetical protein
MKTRQIRKGEQEKRAARLAKRLASKATIFDKNEFIKQSNESSTEDSAMPEKKIPICDESCYCGKCSYYKKKVEYCYDPWAFADDPIYDGCSYYYTYINCDAARAHHEDLMFANGIYEECHCFCECYE